MSRLSSIGVAILLVCALSAAAQQFTVAGYNARHVELDEGALAWDARREMALEILSDAAPDLLLLQEAAAMQREDLLAGLEWLRCAGCDVEFDNHNAILYHPELLKLRQAGTFWLSDTPDVAHSESWGNEVPRFVTWARFETVESGRQFVVYNTHLDHAHQGSRLRSLEAIVAHAAENAAELPIILGGDLNAKTDWPELEYLLAPVEGSPHLPLTDPLAELSADEEVGGTYHAFDAEPEFARIDYILLSEEFQPIAARIITTIGDDGTPPSDHFPILVSVEMSSSR